MCCCEASEVKRRSISVEVGGDEIIEEVKGGTTLIGVIG
jgi:hypothetical protein